MSVPKITRKKARGSRELRAVLQARSAFREGAPDQARASLPPFAGFLALPLPGADFGALPLARTALPSLADGQCITMDDNGGANITETVTFNATAGTQYFVIVDGFNAATGTYDLNIAGTGCNLVPVGLQTFSVD